MGVFSVRKRRLPECRRGPKKEAEGSKGPAGKMLCDGLRFFLSQIKLRSVENRHPPLSIYQQKAELEWLAGYTHTHTRIDRSHEGGFRISCRRSPCRPR